MADADPPNEIDDGKSPTNGNIDSPNAYATNEKIADGIQQNHRNEERDAETEQPAVGHGPGQHDRTDLVGDRGKGMPGLDNRCAAFASRYVFGWTCHRFLTLFRHSDPRDWHLLFKSRFLATLGMTNFKN